jgi:aspartyl-tRNA(Asn)/glutamyl-tRNA(Gln) amidotransferase subunit C
LVPSAQQAYNEGKGKAKQFIKRAGGFMSISSKDVRNLSKLAGIRIMETEEEALAKDLSTIFQWIDTLKEVDVSKIQLHEEIHSTPERADVVTESPQPKAILANAPDVLEDWFAVPKVI